MGLSSVGQLFAFARETQDLFALQAKMKDGLVAMDDRLRAVEDRLTRLEAERGQVITEARSAATGAATMIASAVLADAITRVTRLEDGIRRLEPDPALLPWRNGSAA
jgi:uncharacterized protein (UPF0335 family)